MWRTLILSVFIFILIAQYSPAQTPRTMSYQGLLTNAGGTPVADGNYSLTFKLYSTEMGGAALWTETHPSVAVIKGVFNVILGSITPLNLPFDQQYWLGVTVGAGTELMPRVKLTSSPYSLNAQNVADGAVTTAKLADNAVTTAKIQPNVVSSVDGVVNDGGNIDMVPQNAITITPNDAANTVTIGESHSARTDNPHNTTAAQTGALVSLEGVSNPGGNINLIPGSNITIDGNDGANTITISATNNNTWKLTGNSGTTPGTDFLGTTDNNALEFKVYKDRVLRLEPNATGPNIIGGFSGNSITSGVYGATISGGGAEPYYPNHVTDSCGTVGGGMGNRAGDNAGIVDDTRFATVSGGLNNVAGGESSTVCGGSVNLASGDYSTVGGGWFNTAGGIYSFAAGRRAKAMHDGSFVWGDSTDSNVESTGVDQFVVRARGGVYFKSKGDVILTLEADTDNVFENDNPGILFSQDGGAVTGYLGYLEGTNRLILENRYNSQMELKASGGIYLYTNDAKTTGAYLSAGGSGWHEVSDRAMKNNIREVDGKEILNRLSGIPVSQWSYKTQDPSIEHIGPIAQDFREAFGLGEDDKSINSIDADGVALAAIQGLYELVKEKNAQIAAMQEENVALRKRLDKQDARLEALEALMQLNGAGK